jgi:c-di-GMP-binding flagellar brake protein YcgR
MIQSIGKPIRAKCTCGIKFTVLFERRANYRKPIGLLARFARKVNSELQVGEAVINDLSRGGLSMRVQRGVELKVGEVVTIEFRLDNMEQTLIRAQVAIKSIRRGAIGAEFQSLDDHTRKLLGFYLMP